MQRYGQGEARHVDIMMIQLGTQGNLKTQGRDSGRKSGSQLGCFH